MKVKILIDDVVTELYSDGTDKGTRFGSHLPEEERGQFGSYCKGEARSL